MLQFPKSVHLVIVCELLFQSLYGVEDDPVDTYMRGVDWMSLGEVYGTEFNLARARVATNAVPLKEKQQVLELLEMDIACDALGMLQDSHSARLEVLYLFPATERLHDVFNLR